MRMRGVNAAIDYCDTNHLRTQMPDSEAQKHENTE
jgi:hypothetical protein